MQSDALWRFFRRRAGKRCAKGRKLNYQWFPNPQKQKVPHTADIFRKTGNFFMRSAAADNSPD